MRKTPSVLCAVITTVLAVAVNPTAAVASVPAPADPLVIELVTANGTGCPPGTAAVTVSPDNNSFTVAYSAFTASVGVGATATDWRKNCLLNVLVQVPDGFRYTVSGGDHNGFASLATGSSATQRANHYFQGQAQTAYVTHSFQGGADFDWQTTDDVPIVSQVWSPCGAQRNLNINTELRVTAGTSDTRTTTSFLTLDSTEYHLIWDACL